MVSITGCACDSRRSLFRRRATRSFPRRRRSHHPGDQSHRQADRFIQPPLARQERDLERVIKLIALFEPFILHNDHVFEARTSKHLRGAAPGRAADFRLRRALDRLVGLLDQRAHSGAAQVVLSSDRRPSAGTRPATQRRALGGPCGSRSRGQTGDSGNDPLKLKNCGHFPDRLDRLYRRACCGNLLARSANR